jgi:hypothetical protein
MVAKPIARATKKVAIMVPLSNRAELTADEQISLRHLRHFLGAYDKFAVVPKGLHVDLPDFTLLHFDTKYFGSAENHKKLLFSPELYLAFGDYEFMLTYHLDALVFSDQLLYWCEQGYDFIGPPWIAHPDAPYAGMPTFEGKVGNGGFCLKRVAAMLEVLYSSRRAIAPVDYWHTRTNGRSLAAKLRTVPRYVAMHSRRFNNVNWELRHWRRAEEGFLANRAVHYFPDFRIAPLQEALRFGFEAVPTYCFERNGGRMPFGCHAWPRYERAFWLPHLLA